MTPSEQRGSLAALRQLRHSLPLLCLALALLVLTRLAQQRDSLHLPSAPSAAVQRSLALPPTVARAFELVATQERARLAESAGSDAKPPEPWKVGATFQAVGISLPLAPPILKHDPRLGDGEGDKNIVGLQSLGKGGS